MATFKNPDNLAVPNEEFTRQCFETMKKNAKVVKEVEKEITHEKKRVTDLENQIKVIQDSISLLRQKLAKIVDDTNDIREKISVYNVYITNIFTDETMSFTSLKEATEFRDGLLAAGIAPEDVEIELSNYVSHIDEVDGHKQPDLYGYRYDPDAIYKQYKCAMNQHKKQKLENIDNE